MLIHGHKVLTPDRLKYIAEKFPDWFRLEYCDEEDARLDEDTCLWLIVTRGDRQGEEIHACHDDRSYFSSWDCFIGTLYEIASTQGVTLYQKPSDEKLQIEPNSVVNIEELPGSFLYPYWHAACLACLEGHGSGIIAWFESEPFEFPEQALFDATLHSEPWEINLN